MMDFEQVRARAFEELSKIFNIEKVIRTAKNRLGGDNKIEQWRIVLEVSFSDKIVDFVVFLELKQDFPLTIPVIYLSEEDYRRIKYIPHVDDRRNICLFDQENIKLETDRPVDIIKACLKRAAKIISDGINGVNTEDFRDEVVAYWANIYSAKDEVFEAYLGEGVESLIPGVHTGHLLSPAYHNVHFFMGSGSADSQKIIDFFRLRGHKVTEQTFYYLGEVSDLKPPFDLSSKGLINFIRDNFKLEWISIKRYLNQSFAQKFFSISLNTNEERLFFGFYVPVIKQEINGWRTTSLTSLNVLETIQPLIPVSRIAFTYFSKERLKKRTDGISALKKPYKFMIAGLGSIGSNLLYHLSSLEVSDFILCDPEIFSLENVNRHLLSFNDVGKTKVEGLARYITFNDPFINIIKHKGSIVEMIKSSIGRINSVDIIFCAIGKDAIENYILDCLASGEITRPIMLFWVEPYLIGGHALYINPLSGFSLKDLEESGYYRYNIISTETYADPKHHTLLREAGCQGSYVPYGKAAISLFFANLIPQLFSVIDNPPAGNIAFTYVGDLSIAEKQGLKLSALGIRSPSNQLMINLI